MYGGLAQDLCNLGRDNVAELYNSFFKSFMISKVSHKIMHRDETVVALPGCKST